MYLISKEQPTRIQPHRAVKTSPKTSSTIGGRVTKKPTSLKLTLKKTKSPGSGTTIDAKSTDGDSDYVEDTDTDNPFADDKKDSYLKPTDIAVGNIISTGHHEAYAEPVFPNYPYRTKFVREAGDGCGHVHSRYRKFVIVARFKKHFVSLPIYSSRFAFLDARGDHAEYAEILLEVGVKEHLRVLGKENLKDAPIPPEWVWGK